VAVCRSCGAILDREKAAQYGLVPSGRKERQRNQEPQSQPGTETGK
jgi:hypothetical protein